MPFDTTSYIFYALVSIIVLLILWIIRLEYKLNKMLCGKGDQSIDDNFATLKKEMNGLKKYKEVSEKYIESMDERLRKSITGISTVRFNPFKGTGSGGNQSFATALVSEGGDGVVFSSLYSREHVSIFSKPLTAFSSSYELTEEEKNAVSNAKESLK